MFGKTGLVPLQIRKPSSWDTRDWLNATQDKVMTRGLCLNSKGRTFRSRSGSWSCSGNTWEGFTPLLTKPKRQPWKNWLIWQNVMVLPTLTALLPDCSPEAIKPRSIIPPSLSGLHFATADGLPCNIYWAFTMWQALFCPLELHTYTPRTRNYYHFPNKEGHFTKILQNLRLREVKITQLKNTKGLSNHYVVHLKLI